MSEYRTHLRERVEALAGAALALEGAALALSDLLAGDLPLSAVVGRIETDGAATGPLEAKDAGPGQDGASEAPARTTWDAVGSWPWSAATLDGEGLGAGVGVSAPKSAATAAVEEAATSSPAPVPAPAPSPRRWWLNVYKANSTAHESRVEADYYRLGGGYCVELVESSALEAAERKIENWRDTYQIMAQQVRELRAKLEAAERARDEATRRIERLTTDVVQSPAGKGQTPRARRIQRLRAQLATAERERERLHGLAAAGVAMWRTLQLVVPGIEDWPRGVPYTPGNWKDDACRAILDLEAERNAARAAHPAPRVVTREELVTMAQHFWREYNDLPGTSTKAFTRALRAIGLTVEGGDA